MAARDDRDDLLLFPRARRALGFVALPLGLARLVLIRRFALQAQAVQRGFLEGRDRPRHLADFVAAAERGNLGLEVARREAEHGIPQLTERLGGGAPDEDGRGEAGAKREKHGAENNLPRHRLRRRQPRARRLALGRDLFVELVHDRADQVQRAAHSLCRAHELRLRGADGFEGVRIVLEAGAKRVLRIGGKVRALQGIVEPAVTDLPLAGEGVVVGDGVFDPGAAHRVQGAEHALSLDRILIGYDRFDAIGQRLGACLDAIGEAARTRVAQRLMHVLQIRELFRDRLGFHPQVGNRLFELLAMRQRDKAVDALGQDLHATDEFLQVDQFAAEADVAAGGFHLDRGRADVARSPLQGGIGPGVGEGGGHSAATDEIGASDDEKASDESDADQGDADFDR